MTVPPLPLRRQSNPCAILLVAALAGGLYAAAPAPPAGGQAADFEKAEVGQGPEDLLVLAGNFAVREFDGGRVLEVPGEPLEYFGFLFGTAEFAESEASARVWAARTGRRFPEFGLGTNDISGYKLWLLPGQRRLTLRKGDATVASVPYAWETDTWTHLRLRVVKAGEGKWRVEGKAWAAGGEEPGEWGIAFADSEEPSTGRASGWAAPFSGKPIRFDDLRAGPAAGPRRE